MTRLEEIAIKEEEINKMLKTINRLTQAFINDEFTLGDLVSARDRYDGYIDELKELVDDIIHLRELLGLEQLESELNL